MCSVMAAKAGMQFGTPLNPINCNAVVFGAPPNLTASIHLSFAGAASHTTMNGCTFNCPGGTCRLQGGDGLPVELLDFHIAESGDSQTEGSPEPEDSTTVGATVSKP